VRRPLLLAIILLVLIAPWHASAAAPQSVAVFDFELYDTSLQGEVEGIDPAHAARLALIDQELESQLAASGRFELVDTAPAAAEIARAGYWRSCHGCEAPIAAGLGADLALVGWVQKVSNLILNLNLTIRDAATGELVFAGGVDIRGDTDEAWLHGIRYLLKRRLFAAAQ
jgi:hypothetical protein